jgi:hypothetical protein
MTILEKAIIQRANIIKAMMSLDDKDASKTPELFDKLTEGGELVKVGTRINWNGQLKRAAVDIWDTAENNPDNAPTLWENINYKDGIRIIPETITVGLAFSKDELGWWGDVIYKSLVNDNVYTPEDYAANWEIVE